MKCEEFELSVRELARHQLFGELMEAGLRAQMATHALDCASCTARLANARSLSEGLRSLALSTEPHHAPDHLEAALLAAFRQPAAATVVPLAAVRARKQWPRWAYAVAAVLLIGLFAYVMRGAIRNTPEVVTAPQVVAGGDGTPTQTPPVNAPPVPRQPSPSLTPVNPSPVKTAAVNRSVLASAKRNKAARYRIERYLVESEIATDFLPLTENADVTRNANMQTIRVEVPRMMMSRFGLPVSFERAAEPMKADLLIGPDGQTRAIRFVQTEFEQPQIISANTSRDQ